MQQKRSVCELALLLLQLLMKTNQILTLLILLFIASPVVAQQKTGQDFPQTLVREVPYETVQVAPSSQSCRPKNVVLMIGDGMSLSHISTLMAMNQGRVNLNNAEVVGLMTTHTADTLITDSAASGTAMATGVKTNYHYLGVDTEGRPLYNLTDFTRERGLSSGLVAVCRLWDATPAAFAAHNIDRDDSFAVLADYSRSNVDLVIGGGREKMQNRPDGRNLFEELQATGFQTPTSMGELRQITSGKVFAAVADVDLPQPKERGDYLAQASLFALNHLAQNDEGFFLMIEGSQLDDYGHFGDLDLLMQETEDFDKTVGAVLKWAEQNRETLVIVTADHETGGLTLVGGDLEEGYVVGKFSTGGHSGLLVPVYVYGPGADHFSGIYDNTDIYHKITHLLSK